MLQLTNAKQSLALLVLPILVFAGGQGQEAAADIGVTMSWKDDCTRLNMTRSEQEYYVGGPGQRSHRYEGVEVVPGVNYTGQIVTSFADQKFQSFTFNRTLQDNEVWRFYTVVDWPAYFDKLKEGRWIYNSTPPCNTESGLQFEWKKPDVPEAQKCYKFPKPAQCAILSTA